MGFREFAKKHINWFWLGLTPIVILVDLMAAIITALVASYYLIMPLRNAGITMTYLRFVDGTTIRVVNRELESLILISIVYLVLIFLSQFLLKKIVEKCQLKAEQKNLRTDVQIITSILLILAVILIGLVASSFGT